MFNLKKTALTAGLLVGVLLTPDIKAPQHFNNTFERRALNPQYHLNRINSEIASIRLNRNALARDIQQMIDRMSRMDRNQQRPSPVPTATSTRFPQIPTRAAMPNDALRQILEDIEPSHVQTRTRRLQPQPQASVSFPRVVSPRGTASQDLGGEELVAFINSTLHQERPRREQPVTVSIPVKEYRCSNWEQEEDQTCGVCQDVFDKFGITSEDSDSKLGIIIHKENKESTAVNDNTNEFESEAHSSHILCSTCVKKMQSKACPLCRKEIDHLAIKIQSDESRAMESSKLESDELNARSRTEEEEVVSISRILELAKTEGQALAEQAKLAEEGVDQAILEQVLEQSRLEEQAKIKTQVRLKEKQLLEKKGRIDIQESETGSMQRILEEENLAKADIQPKVPRRLFLEKIERETNERAEGAGRAGIEIEATQRIELIKNQEALEKPNTERKQAQLASHSVIQGFITNLESTDRKSIAECESEVRNEMTSKITAQIAAQAEVAKARRLAINLVRSVCGRKNVCGRKAAQKEQRALLQAQEVQAQVQAQVQAKIQAFLQAAIQATETRPAEPAQPSRREKKGQKKSKRVHRLQGKAA